MDMTTLIVQGVIVLMIIAIIVAFVRAALAKRRPTLKPLAAEAIERYGNAWDHIEARFLDAPEQAIREADSLVVALLNERGHPLEDHTLPRHLTLARSEGTARQGKGTENLRHSMLHYRAVVEQMVGKQYRERARTGRRETA